MVIVLFVFASHTNDMISFKEYLLISYVQSTVLGDTGENNIMILPHDIKLMKNLCLFKINVQLSDERS